MLRRVALIGALATLAAAGILAGCADEENRDPSSAREEAAAETGQHTAEPVARRELGEETERVTGTTAEETSEEELCSEDEFRIGDFTPPEESVPAYEILEEERVERDCVQAIRLLVDTQASSESDYTLITRDLKSTYKALDAVSIEFTDITGTLSYNGGAVIFNTRRGSQFIGFIHHPPSNEGYYVSAKD